MISEKEVDLRSRIIKIMLEELRIRESNPAIKTEFITGERSMAYTVLSDGMGITAAEAYRMVRREEEADV